MTNGSMTHVRDRMRFLLPVVVLSFAWAACVGPGAPGPKAQVGAATGAAAGGLLGAALGGDAEGIIAGVLLGGLLGGSVGTALDNIDREYARRNAYFGLEHAPTGTTSRWDNPDTGNSGAITPTRTYRVGPEQYCREFQQTVTVGGRSERAYGTACRQPDGSWKITP